MCVSPNTLSDGTLASCRNCWQCNLQFTESWAGKIIAESQHTKETYFITLTYGRDRDNISDHMNAVILTYSDVQKFLKTIRSQIGKFRYFVAGEYGSINKRAHWHMILFPEKPLPQIFEYGQAEMIDGKKQRKQFKLEYDKKISFPYWKHGHTYWRAFEPQFAFYTCKYALKNETHDSHTGKSTKPPLGTQFFNDYADSCVQQGVAPKDPFYTLPNIRRKQGQGKLIKFMMRGKVLDNFIERFAAQWKIQRPQQHLPNSEMIEDYFDTKTKLQRDKEMSYDEYLIRKNPERYILHVDAEEAIQLRDERTSEQQTYKRAKAITETRFNQ